MADDTSLIAMSLTRMEIFPQRVWASARPFQWALLGQWLRSVPETLNLLPLRRQCFHLAGLCDVFTATGFYCYKIALYAFSSETLRGSFDGKV